MEQKPQVRRVPFQGFKEIDVTLDSGACSMCGIGQPEIQPGETRHVHHVAQCHFLADRAFPVDGVDYDAFTVESALVGANLQWPEGFPRTARGFLKGIRAEEGEKHSFDTCKPGQAIRLAVTNRSDRPRRFAVKLVGRTIL